MFERYTERARRVIFFARYEASQTGCPTIETGHMILGLIRESRELVSRFLPGRMCAEVRSELEQDLRRQGTIPTSIDLPLTAASKRALSSAAREADALGSRFIAPEHILLGVLSEDSPAREVLARRGISADSVREGLRENPIVESAGLEPRFTFEHVYVPDAETATRIAEAVLGPIAGREAVESQRPFDARLEGVNWWVRGTGQDAGAALLVVVSQQGRILSAGREGETFGGGRLS